MRAEAGSHASRTCAACAAGVHCTHANDAKWLLSSAGACFAALSISAACAAGCMHPRVCGLSTTAAIQLATRQSHTLLLSGCFSACAAAGGAVCQAVCVHCGRVQAGQWAGRQQRWGHHLPAHVGAQPRLMTTAGHSVPACVCDSLGGVAMHWGVAANGVLCPNKCML